MDNEENVVTEETKFVWRLGGLFGGGAVAVETRHKHGVVVPVTLKDSRSPASGMAR